MSAGERMAVKTTEAAAVSSGPSSAAIAAEQTTTAVRLADGPSTVGFTPDLRRASAPPPIVTDLGPNSASYSLSSPTLIGFENAVGTVPLRAAETKVLANMADGPAFGGALYPPERLQRLVGYLERRNVSVFGTEGNPGFMARADGSGQMLLPENPTVLQVKHELSHTLTSRRWVLNHIEIWAVSAEKPRC